MSVASLSSLGSGGGSEAVNPVTYSQEYGGWSPVTETNQHLYLQPGVYNQQHKTRYNVYNDWPGFINPAPGNPGGPGEDMMSSNPGGNFSQLEEIAGNIDRRELRTGLL